MKPDVKTKALKLLSLRARSQEELRAALEKRGYEEVEIRACLRELSRAGLVDDEAFAHGWVGGRRERKGLGAARLRVELRQKGVSRELIARALQSDEEGEEARALRIAGTRWQRLARLAPEVARRRLGQFLLRQGYEQELVYRVVRSLSARPSA